ncbi:MAG: cytochrome c [Acidobacteriota bacterium]
MKKPVRLAIIAVFSVAAFTTVTFPISSGADASAKVTSPRSLYSQNCSRCHGSDGHANTPTGRKLEAADLTSADIRGKGLPSIQRTIRNGRPDMPSFGKRLTPRQISAIAGYVLSLRGN